MVNGSNPKKWVDTWRESMRKLAQEYGRSNYTWDELYELYLESGNVNEFIDRILEILNGEDE